MAENSTIEWTDHTFNPWEGCQKIGPGCNHCYAEARNARFSGGTAINWGPGAPRRRTSLANWRKPLAWNKEPFWQCECGWRGGDRELDREPESASNLTDGVAACPACNRIDIKPARCRVFCASLADVFDNEVPEQWRVQLFDLIYATPNLDWLLLTKRIGNAVSMLPNYRDGHPMQWGDGWPNVWIGATIVNQEEANRDIPKLLQVPARVRFLSMEPLLGPVDLERPMPGPDIDQGGGATICQPWYIQSGIDWVIVGGESGSQARPMSPDWARSLRDQCTAAGVPFLFKQWGEWLPMLGQAEGVPVGQKAVTADGWVMGWAGKKAAGRLLDGVQHDGFPEVA